MIHPTPVIPEFSEPAYKWRAEIIRAHDKHVRLGLVYKKRQPHVQWNENLFTWQEFIPVFNEWCEDHDVIPF